MKYEGNSDSEPWRSHIVVVGRKLSGDNPGATQHLRDKDIKYFKNITLQKNLLYTLY